jgi:hypothetical protein
MRMLSHFGMAVLAVLLHGDRNESHAGSILCVNSDDGGCFPTIQAAADAAVSGDTIEVAAGSYAGASLQDGQRLTIRGQGRESTTITSGEFAYSVLGVGHEGNLVLRDVTIDSDSSNAIDGSQGKLAVFDSELVGPYTPGGDGVEDFDSVWIVRSTIRGFSVGIEVDHGKIRVEASTLADNSTGAILGSGSRISVRSSTLSGNQVAVSGSWVKISSSTIVDNNSGVSAGKLSLGGTIVANNTGFDCSASGGRSKGFNLVESGSCLEWADSDIVATDPQVEALADNGGPTMTHALAPGSPALGVVNRGSYCKPDQRGTERTQPCDIGAFERP